MGAGGNAKYQFVRALNSLIMTSSKLEGEPRRESSPIRKPNETSPNTSSDGRTRSGSCPEALNLSRKRNISESGTLKAPHPRTVKTSPKLNDDVQRQMQRPDSPMSPRYKSLGPFECDTSEDDNKAPKKAAAIKKGSCPCRATSSGKEWLLKCCQCTQHWHASCANLKGANKISEKSPQQAGLDAILDLWQCPWCFTPPFPRPSSHTSSIIATTLESKVDYAQNIQVISDAISGAVTNSIPMVEIASLEAKLSTLSIEIYEFQELRKGSSPEQNHLSKFSEPADHDCSIAMP